MATYNGEKYLEEQILSIINQSYSNWQLFINDDCSTDNTCNIAKKYAHKYPDKIFFTVNKSNSGSSGANFFNMIERSKGDIVMTCDQDDIWLKDKVKRAVELIGNTNVPTLLHTDLITIDQNKNVIHKSMISSQKIDVKRNQTKRLLTQNTVTGCTMAFNRSLADIIKKPSNLPVHDWYIAVIASIYGKIIFDSEAQILYRQHSNNYCGEVDMNSPQYISERFKNKKKAKIMLEYGNMKNYSKLKRLYTVFKYGIWKNGIIRKLGQIYFM